MTEKSKTLSEIVYLDGPIYNRFQIFLKEWIIKYKERNLSGDSSVIMFIKHFGEIKIFPESLKMKSKESKNET